MFAVSIARRLLLAAGCVSILFPVSGMAQDESVEEQEKSELEFRNPTETDGPLAWRYREGQVFKMSMVQDLKTSMELANQKFDTWNAAKNQMTLRITSVEDNIATATNTIDRMVMSITAPGGVSIEFDTEEDIPEEVGAKAIAEMLKPMVGVAVTQKMAPDGKIFDVEVPAAMLKGIRGAAGAMFNEKTIKEITSKAALVFPEETPSVGGTWMNSADLEMGPVTVRTETTYAYMGVAEVEGKPMHVIQANVAMSFPEGMGGMPVAISDEDSTIEFFFDGNAGFLVKSEVNQSLTMTIGKATKDTVPTKQVLRQSVSMTMTEQEE